MPRPRGYRLNVDAFEDRLEELGRIRTQVAEDAEISLGALMDLAKGRRGASPEMVQRLAAALRCRPATLFPELSKAAQHRFEGVAGVIEAPTVAAAS